MSDGPVFLEELEGVLRIETYQLSQLDPGQLYILLSIGDALDQLGKWESGLVQHGGRSILNFYMRF